MTTHTSSLFGLLLIFVAASCGGSADDIAHRLDASVEHPVESTDVPPRYDVADGRQDLAADGDGAIGRAPDTVGNEPDSPRACSSVPDIGCFTGEICHSPRVDAICVNGSWGCPAGSGPTEFCPPDPHPGADGGSADAP
jgi:hypothetical protein